MKSRKTGVTLVAGILIGAAIFAFVAYTAFDAIGFGRTVENFDEYAPTWGTNETIELSFVPAEQPVVTFWDAGGAVNGTVPTTNITWHESMSSIYIFHWNWTAYDVADTAPYGKDTSYLRFNYTSIGADARAITMPVIILVAVFAIIVVTGVMVAGTKSLSGGKGNKKQW